MNLFIPQWQGSGNSTVLYRGAQALKNYCQREYPEAVFTDITISEHPELDIKENILGYTALASQLTEIREVLRKHTPASVFTLGGGCGVEIPVVSYLKGLYNNLEVYWFDAHGDLNSPGSSPSKHFHGMPLRYLTDNIVTKSISDDINRIEPDDIRMIGTRDLDPPEKEFIKKNRIRVLNSISDLKQNTDRKNTHAYVHIDLDVLDPACYENVKCPVKGGLSVETLIQMISEIQSLKTLAGISILENTETDISRLRKTNKILETGLSL